MPHADSDLLLRTVVLSLLFMGSPFTLTGERLLHSSQPKHKLVSAEVVADGVGSEAWRRADAALHHFVAGDLVVLDDVSVRRRGAFGAPAEVDAAAEHVGLAGQVDAGVAMRRVDAQETIARDEVSRADDEDSAVPCTVEGIAENPDVAVLHVGVGVVHDEAEAFHPDAKVSDHLSIMK